MHGQHLPPALTRLSLIPVRAHALPTITTTATTITNTTEATAVPPRLFTPVRYATATSATTTVITTTALPPFSVSYSRDIFFPDFLSIFDNTISEWQQTISLRSTSSMCYNSNNQHSLMPKQTGRPSPCDPFSISIPLLAPDSVWLGCSLFSRFYNVSACIFLPFCLLLVSLFVLRQSNFLSSSKFGLAQCPLSPSLDMYN